MESKYKKFLAIGGLVVIVAGLTIGSNYIAQQNKLNNVCNPIGQVTAIHEASTPYYNINVGMINKNGDPINLQTKHASGDIQSIDSTYYSVPIKAEVNGSVKELRLKHLSKGDSLDKCKNEVRVIKK